MGIFVSNCIGSCVVIYTPQITETWGEKNQHLHRNEMNVPFFIFFFANVLNVLMHLIMFLKIIDIIFNL